ncbi:MAG: methyltransferase domain-containing protein, partial [Deltaproteobacteria bacterium]|nr:methyltransferase domain-containing protein [Deltaproteobacteria bacterium]
MDQKVKKAVNHSEYEANWVRSAWGDSAKKFIENGGRIIRPRIKRALDIAQLAPGMHILDVGCGRGEVVFYCARMGCWATGVDYSKEVISIAAQVLQKMDPHVSSRIAFHLGDINEIEMEPESLDRVFLLDIVEHLYDWQLSSLYKTLHRLLKPSGYLVIHTLPNRWIFKFYAFIRFFFPWLEKDPRGEFEKKIHVNEQSCVSLRKLLDESGFFCNVRLEQELLAQAEWYKDVVFGDRRDRFYRLLRNPASKFAVN